MATKVTAVPYPFTSAVARVNVKADPGPRLGSSLSDWGWYFGGGSGAGTHGIDFPTTLPVKAIKACANLAQTVAGSSGSSINFGAQGVSPGTKIRVSAYVSSTAARDVQLALPFLNASDAVLGVETTAASVGPGWTRISVQGTAPSGTTKIIASVTTVAPLPAGQRITVAGVLVEPIASFSDPLADYVDGDMGLIAPGLMASWSGTPGASYTQVTARTPAPTAQSITPAKFTLWESTRERQVALHPVLGTSETDVTIASGMGPRSGTFEAYFADEAQALAFEQLVESDVVMITDPDRPLGAGMYIVVARIKPRMLREQQYVVSAEWVQTVLDGSAW